MVWSPLALGAKMLSTLGLTHVNPDRTTPAESLSAATDKLDDFQFVSIFNAHVCPGRTSNDVAVSLYGNPICLQLQSFDQMMKAGVRAQLRELSIAPVDGEIHWIAAFTGSWVPSGWTSVNVQSWSPG
jgi:hypothetical protein